MKLSAIFHLTQIMYPVVLSTCSKSKTWYHVEQEENSLDAIKLHNSIFNLSFFFINKPTLYPSYTLQLTSRNAIILCW